MGDDKFIQGFRNLLDQYAAEKGSNQNNHSSSSIYHASHSTCTSSRTSQNSNPSSSSSHQTPCNQNHPSVSEKMKSLYRPYKNEYRAKPRGRKRKNGNALEGEYDTKRVYLMPSKSYVEAVRRQSQIRQFYRKKLVVDKVTLSTQDSDAIVEFKLKNAFRDLIPEDCFEKLLCMEVELLKDEGGELHLPNVKRGTPMDGANVKSLFVNEKKKNYIRTTQDITELMPEEPENRNLNNDSSDDDDFEEKQLNASTEDNRFLNSSPLLDHSYTWQPRENSSVNSGILADLSHTGTNSNSNQPTAATRGSIVDLTTNPITGTDCTSDNLRESGISDDQVRENNNSSDYISETRSARLSYFRDQFGQRDEGKSTSSVEPSSKSLVNNNTADNMSDDEALELLSTVVTNEIQKHLYIDRHSAFESAILGMRRKCFDVRKRVSVQFTNLTGIKEEAIDHGGPKNEFFTLALEELHKSSLFEGPESERFIALDIVALRDRKYFYAGQIIAIALANRGPGPTWLSEEMFTCIVENSLHKRKCAVSEIFDEELRKEWFDIQAQSDLKSFNEKLSSCSLLMTAVGVANPSLATIAEKETFLDTVLHSLLVVRVEPAFKQFIEGLDTLNCLSLIQIKQEFVGTLSERAFYTRKHLQILIIRR